MGSAFITICFECDACLILQKALFKCVYIRNVMIQEKYKKAVDKFVKITLDKHRDKIDGIILFGSVAREEAREDSDIDIILIVNDDSFKMQKLISEVVVKILFETEIYVSAKVISSEEYNLLKEINSSFYRDVVREGVLIG